jgi:glycogen phosphorylase
MTNTVRALPAALLPLTQLALDLRWTWSHEDDALWRRMHAELWERTRNPWLMLQLLPSSRLQALAADADFLAELERRTRERGTTLRASTWFAETGYGIRLRRVAYFSMEFGLHEALPIYAGGLGILAGDHLKTASDLGVPLVGVGILWQQGYFRQMLDGAGRQHEVFPFNDPATLPIQPVLNAEGEPLHVAIALPGRSLRLRVWEAIVGRVRLYLLDANHPVNGPAERGLTGMLYGGDTEVRLLQEMILGIGGWRALEALGLDVDVCHLNEGHAAMVVVERARSFMQKHDVSFREALWATRAGNVFTTHTAVAAGFDTFGAKLIETYTAYFEAYVRQLGVGWPELLGLGRHDPHDPNEPFSMALLAMRGCARVNGVSRLHGEVSRRLFQNLFPRWPEREVPIGHVTNGVHVASWDSPDADELWTAAGGKERWRGELEDLGTAIGACSDEQLWSMRAFERADLVRYARERLRRQLAQRGVMGEALSAADGALDPEALTLGFARRFAGYKRPNLLLADPDRLRRLLSDPDRPIQLILAGKAHPSDGEGKAMIEQWVRFAMHPELRHRVVFLEEYDMTLAKELVQGVDVWINTPRRPWAACGTSGMKVLVNGGLNLSTLDGWWDEAFVPQVGWALGAGRAGESDDSDAADAMELYRILEEEVIPEYYERNAAGIPGRWLQRLRASMAELAPRFSSNRMLRQYVEEFYLPAAADFHARTAEQARIARELAVWEARLVTHWSDVDFVSVDVRTEDGMLHVSAEVALGRLHPDEVLVELYADATGDEPPARVPLGCEGPASGRLSAFRFAVAIATQRPAAHFTPRVVPRHPHAMVPLELPLIRWRDWRLP